MHDVFKEAGHKYHIFGPPIHGIGLEFEEAQLPAGHAFFHGEKGPGPLAVGTVIALGNCGLYTGPWGGNFRRGGGVGSFLKTLG